MKIASLDIGSNTLLLLIAEINLDLHRLKSLKNSQFIIRLSEGLIHNKSISIDSVGRLVKSLESVREIINQHNCDIVIASGTHSFREAENAFEIVQLVREKFNIVIDILNPEEEAEYSYIGATFDMWNDKPISIIDIGGGSTEICVGKNEEIIYKQSLKLGVVSLRNQLLKTSLISDKQIPDCSGQIAKIKKLIKDSFSPIQIESTPVYNIALAGTPLTLKAMTNKGKQFNFDLDAFINNQILTKEEISLLINEMRNKSPEDILLLYGDIVKNREDLILIGALILDEILESLKIDKVYISSKGLRYGAIQKLLFKKFGMYFVK